MILPTDEQRILKLLSQGYVIPISIYDDSAIKNVLNGKFLIENKPVKVIKNFNTDYKDTLFARLDSRFNFEVDELIS